MKQKYKQTEIGVIPEDWEITTLEKEYELFAGGDLNTDDYSDVKTSKYQYAILSNGLQNNGVYGFCSRPKYCGNAVTITGRGDIGHCVYRENAFSAIIRLLVCQPRKQINSKFISEYLESTNPFVFESTGVPQLTVPQIKNTLIPLPPFAEQNRIAEALSDIDELISSLEKLIAKKKAIKQGAMQQLLTGKTRLPGFSDAWQKRSIEEIAIFPTATVPTDKIDTRYYIGTDNMIKDKGGIQENSICIEYEYVKEYQNNDILLSNIRPYLKKIWFADRDGGCSNDVIVIRLKESKEINPQLLYFLLSQDSFFDEIMSNAIGTKMPRGDKETIKAYRIAFPTVKREQEVIVNILLDMYLQIKKFENCLAKYKQLKDGMMQQLLTGKIRLM